MEFKDVEKARQVYQAALDKEKKKYRELSLKINIPLLAIELVLAAIFFIANPRLFSDQGSGLFTPSTNINKGLSPELIPFFVVFAIIFILTQAAIIHVIVYLIVGHKSTEEYTEYKKAYKAYFISQQLAKIFTNLQYDHGKILSKDLLESTGIINVGDEYSSNDLVTGKYKKVSFAQADVRIREYHTKVDSDGNKTRVLETIFKGRFLVFTFPKKIEHKLIVSPQIVSSLFLQDYLSELTGFDLIETESETFNRIFNVYAEDGVEAFYILTPDIMANLIKISTHYQDNLTLYFANNGLFIGINDNGDAFEPPHNANEPLNEKKEIQRVVDDIKPIVELIDELKLDR